MTYEEAIAELKTSYCTECPVVIEKNIEYEKHINHLENRLSHLLKSEYIRKFDEVDRNGKYVLDIKNADGKYLKYDYSDREILGKTIGKTKDGGLIIELTKGGLEHITKMLQNDD